MSADFDGLTVSRWYYAMCRQDQRPMLIDFGTGRITGRRIVEVKVLGRDYDDDDCQLWHWMRQHDAEVMQYLQGLGAWRYSWGGRVRPIGTTSGLTPAQEAASIIAAADRARFHLHIWIDDRGRDRISASTPLVDDNLEPLPEPQCDVQAWERVIVPGLKKLRPVVADLLWQRQVIQEASGKL
ncbi:hypothetical protein [Dongia sp.]|uniref:hypothetical protein n=1 Tax=Dongia sp. TaxID=1977262 RepID=UPI0035AFA7DF